MCCLGCPCQEAETWAAAASSGVGRGTRGADQRWGCGGEWVSWEARFSRKVLSPFGSSAANESLVAPSVPQTGSSNTVRASSAVVGTEHGVLGHAGKSPPKCRWVCGGEPSLLNCCETARRVGMGRDFGGQGIQGLPWTRSMAINVPHFDKLVFGRTGNK